MVISTQNIKVSRLEFFGCYSINVLQYCFESNDGSLLMIIKILSEINESNTQKIENF